MGKIKKLAIICIVMVLLISIIATAVILVLQNNNREKTASTVMTCSVNPSVQFILNENNKVIEVTATNSDGEMLIVKGEFEGLTADAAAQLFVSLATEAGYIDVNSETGTAVTINLDGLKDDYAKMQESITAKVNEYFDENGIVAGAVTTVTKDLETALENISIEAKDYSAMTKEELMAEYVAMAEKLDGIAIANYEQMETKYVELDEIYDAAVELAQQLLASYRVMLTTVEGLLSEDLQEEFKPLFDIAKATTEEELKIALEESKKLVEDAPEYIKTTVEQMIDAVELVYDEMVTKLNQAKEKFETDYNNLIAQMRADSEELLETVEVAINEKINAYTATLEARKAYFNENKEEIQTKIDAYRNTLVQA